MGAQNEQIQVLQEENENLKELLAERQHLLEQMIPPPVVADLLERQKQYRSLSDIWSWQPESEVNHNKARFLRRERAADAPLVGQAKAVYYDTITVFFSDIVGFTDMSRSATPIEVMTFLDELYSQLDNLLSSRHRTLWKVETIGDAYMVAGGLMEVPGCPKTPGDSAREVVAFARSAVRIASLMTMPHGKPCQLRAGVHSGPVMSGVVGSKMPRYCLFGETVNLASRMESTGLPNAVQVSERTWDLLGGSLSGPPRAPEPEESGPADDGMRWRDRGGVPVKGKGIMKTYVLEMPSPEHDEPSKMACARLALVRLATRPEHQYLTYGFFIGCCATAFVLMQMDVRKRLLGARLT